MAVSQARHLCLVWVQDISGSGERTAWPHVVDGQWWHPHWHLLLRPGSIQVPWGPVAGIGAA